MEILRALVVNGKSACGCGRHGVVQCLKPIHACCKVSQSAGQGENHVDTPNPLGRGRESGVHLGLDGACGLCSKDFHTSSHQRGEDGDGEEHDSQSTYPLGHGSPEQYGVGQHLYVVDDGGASGGESRCGLKEGIGDAGDTAMGKEREHTE